MSKRFRKNLLYAFFSFIILNIFSYIVFNKGLNYFTTQSFRFSLCLSVIISVLFYLVLEIMELKQEQLDYIEARMGKIIEYFAIGSGKNGNLELIISEIKEKGEIRWMVAKFISQKIKKDFYGEDKTIVIGSQNLESFQDLLKYVITDCEKSIYWTCPYKPGEWFDNVDIKPGAEEKRERDKRKNLMLDDLPLLKQFSDSSVDKFRFVNLTQSDFNELIGKEKVGLEAENLFKDLANFIRINEKSIKKCKLIFINLDEKPVQIKDCLEDKDIGIYDEEVIISFYKDNNNANLGNIALTLGCQKIAPFLEDFLKYKISSDREGFYDSKQILKKFKDETKMNVKEKYKEITGRRIKI